MKRFLPLFFLLSLSVLSIPTWAETGYATDALSVPIHRGASTQHKILRMVPSGTPLQIMEADDTTGYSKVKTPEGTVGWILTRYLMDQPPPRQRAVQLESQVKNLEEKNRILKEKADVLDTTSTSLTRCNEELSEIQRTAAQALSIERENHNLQQEAAQAREQADYFQQENTLLRDESKRNWFITGASVGLGGVLLGLIMPFILRRRQRRNWGQL
ncbi:MAG: TIGR04211 family SH3 domain-containing protein [Phycisphaerales bacterium]|nr:TIGR04211 family SH3 domain-containing protein [Phycisphaerales bacterium]